MTDARRYAYRRISGEIAETVIKKQAAYGDSFGRSGEIMRILYPSGISLEKLADALTIVRVVDKLFRVATDRDALGENPWVDIQGYSLLAAERIERWRAKLDHAPSPDDAARVESVARFY